MSEQMKAMTLRISEEQHEALTWIAMVRGTSVQAEVRRAIADHVEGRRRDPEFQSRLLRHHKKQESVYERLTW